MRFVKKQSFFFFTSHQISTCCNSDISYRNTMFYEYPADTQMDKAEAQTSSSPEKPNFTDYPARSHTSSSDDLSRPLAVRTRWVFARPREKLKRKLSMSAMDTKGPIVQQGRVSESNSDPIGYHVCLDKAQGVHDKMSACDELELEQVGVTHLVFFVSVMSACYLKSHTWVAVVLNRMYFNWEPVNLAPSTCSYWILVLDTDTNLTNEILNRSDSVPLLEFSVNICMLWGV